MKPINRNFIIIRFDHNQFTITKKNLNNNKKKTFYMHKIIKKISKT